MFPDKKGWSLVISAAVSRDSGDTVADQVARMHRVIYASIVPISMNRTVLLTLELRHEKTWFLHMRKKVADQLRSNCTADQRLCFRYIDSTIPLLSKSEISSLLPSFVAVQPRLSRNWSETREDRFSHDAAHIAHIPYLI